MLLEKSSVPIFLTPWNNNLPEPPPSGVGVSVGVNVGVNVAVGVRVIVTVGVAVDVGSVVAVADGRSSAGAS